MRVLMGGGLFDVPISLGYNPQLLKQTPIWVLLWRYFVDVIKVHNQLAVTPGDYPR